MPTPSGESDVLVLDNIAPVKNLDVVADLGNRGGRQGDGELIDAAWSPAFYKRPHNFAPERVGKRVSKAWPQESQPRLERIRFLHAFCCACHSFIPITQGLRQTTIATIFYEGNLGQ